MIFQLVSISFLLLLTATVIFNQKLSRVLKTGLSVLFTFGILFLLKPEILDRIAQSIGVSYGSDLVFYLTTILVFYLGVIGYQKSRSMEKKIEYLARQIALNSAMSKNHQRGIDV